MHTIYKVEIITRAEKLKLLKDTLAQYGIKGMTLSNVMGAGNQQGKTEVYRGNETTIDLLPKIRIEILIKEEMLDTIISVAKSILKTGYVGDGKIIIMPVSNVIRIRTGEEGVDAI